MLEPKFIINDKLPATWGGVGGRNSPENGEPEITLAANISAVKKDIMVRKFRVEIEGFYKEYTLPQPVLVKKGNTLTIHEHFPLRFVWGFLMTLGYRSMYLTEKGG